MKESEWRTIDTPPGQPLSVLVPSSQLATTSTRTINYKEKKKSTTDSVVSVVSLREKAIMVYLCLLPSRLISKNFHSLGKRDTNWSRFLTRSLEELKWQYIQGRLTEGFTRRGHDSEDQSCYIRAHGGGVCSSRRPSSGALGPTQNIPAGYPDGPPTHSPVLKGNARLSVQVFGWGYEKESCCRKKLPSVTTRALRAYLQIFHSHGFDQCCWHRNPSTLGAHPAQQRTYVRRAYILTPAKGPLSFQPSCLASLFQPSIFFTNQWQSAFERIKWVVHKPKVYQNVGIIIIFSLIWGKWGNKLMHTLTEKAIPLNSK